MQTKNWQALLNEASDTGDVATICDQFLDTWSEAELAGIPATCLPPDVVQPDLIGPYAIQLIAEIGVGNRTTAPLLYAMSTFFTKAALRVAELEEPRPPPPAARHRASGSSA
ncbi:MAG TPA: hypothetical protein VM122_09160 [Usitatibacter sp.]|nr:hypothetical protein [Usitatibacter sp.]